MFKEPISFLYRSRGRPGRIANARKRWPVVYDMFNSGVLRVVDKEKELFKRVVPFKMWSKN